MGPPKAPKLLLRRLFSDTCVTHGRRAGEARNLRSLVSSSTPRSHLRLVKGGGDCRKRCHSSSQTLFCLRLMPSPDPNYGDCDKLRQREQNFEQDDVNADAPPSPTDHDIEPTQALQQKADGADAALPAPEEGSPGLRAFTFLRSSTAKEKEPGYTNFEQEGATTSTPPHDEDQSQALRQDDPETPTATGTDEGGRGLRPFAFLRSAPAKDKEKEKDKDKDKEAVYANIEPDADSKTTPTHGHAPCSSTVSLSRLAVIAPASQCLSSLPPPIPFRFAERARALLWEKARNVAGSAAHGEMTHSPPSSLRAPLPLPSSLLFSHPTSLPPISSLPQ